MLRLQKKKNHFTWLIRCYTALRLFACNQFYLEYVQKLTTKFCFVSPYHDGSTGKICPLYDHTCKTTSSQHLINVLHESPLFFQKLPILSPKHRAQFNYRETTLLVSSRLNRQSQNRQTEENPLTVAVSGRSQLWSRLRKRTEINARRTSGFREVARQVYRFTTKLLVVAF